MLVLTLDGREISWNFAKYYSRKQRSNKSSYHLLAEEILRELFPNSTLYEEVTLPTNPATYADFFVPNFRLIVEVNGEQHYKFNSHFYNDKLAFFRAKARDRMKKEWCDLNELLIVELPYNEKNTWKTTIQNLIWK